MATFEDLNQYLDPGLTLTIGTAKYKLPLASAELGLWSRRLANAGASVPDDATDDELLAAGERARALAEDLPPLPGMDTKTFEEILLGDALYRQMIADRQPDPYVQFCAKTAYVWIVAGEEAAERYWKAGGRPEAMARVNRASRRAQQRTKTSTGTASETPTPGSTSGTSSRPRSAGSGRGRRSRGRRS